MSVSDVSRSSQSWVSTAHLLYSELTFFNICDKKLKNASCEYDRLNGWNSTLQAAWYIFYFIYMEHSTSKPNERVLLVTQLAKLSFNHPSVVLTADVFQYFYKINKPLESAPRGIPSESHPTVGVAPFGSNLSERLSSSREELPVTMKFYYFNGFKSSA